MQTATKKHLSPTVWFLLTGLILGWVGVWNMGNAIRSWSQGSLSSPASLAVIHLIILGFMLTVAYGVLFQIVPIAFQSPPLPRHILYWHLPIHTLAAIGMVLGFAYGWWPLVGWSGTLLLLTGCAFIYFLQNSYRKSRNQTPVHRLLKFPLMGLLFVIVIGLWQAFIPANTNAHTLTLHAVVGGLGFWGGLVLVFSYKLIPMFSLSHGYKASPFRAGTLFFGGVGLVSLVLLANAVWSQDAVGAWYGTGSLAVEDVGILLCALGFLSVGYDLYKILRARKRKRIVRPVVQALISTSVMLLSGICVCIALLAQADFIVLIVLGYIYLFAGLVPLILAYMQKIVPFLWFEYRYSHRPERKTAPLMDDMIPKVLGHAGWIAYFVGVVMSLVGLMSDVPGWVDRTGSTMATLGMVVLFVGLRHVLTIGGRRPED